MYHPTMLGVVGQESCLLLHGALLGKKEGKRGITGLNRQEDSPRDFQPIVCNALGYKEDTRIARRQKTKKQVKILPYGALTWQVKVVTDKFLLKPLANGRNVVC